MTIGVKTMSNDTIGWTHTCNRYKQNVYVSNEPEKNRILFTPIQFFRIIDERWVNSFISGSIHLLFTMLLNSFFLFNWLNELWIMEWKYWCLKIEQFVQFDDGVVVVVFENGTRINEWTHTEPHWMMIVIWNLFSFLWSFFLDDWSGFFSLLFCCL